MEKRDETIILRVTQSERVRIQEKMEELGIRNMSAWRSITCLPDGRVKK